jgi:hypothetical protein
MRFVVNVLDARWSSNYLSRELTINGAGIIISQVNFRMPEKRPRRLLRTLTERLRAHSMVICERYLLIE